MKNQREKKWKLKATDQNTYKHPSILANQVWEEDDRLGNEFGIHDEKGEKQLVSYYTKIGKAPLDCPWTFEMSQ